GSFMVHESPRTAAMAIKTSSTFVNGFNLSPFSSLTVANLVPNGTLPTSPKMSCAFQNCNKPNNINIPASPNPQDHPTISPKYPQSRIPNKAPAFTPI